jgi:hypothetical protein
MKQETINAIRLLATADTEADQATVSRIVQACEPQTRKRDLISAAKACEIIGVAAFGKPVSRVTLWKYVKRGILHPVRYSSRIIRFDRNEVEHYANNGTI